MTFLGNRSKGKVKKPSFVVLYGPDGIGKSTWGSKAPNPIFMDLERGSEDLDVERGETPKSWEAILSIVDELITDCSGFETLVIDTLDAAETLLHSKILMENNAKSMELACGGYGKAYDLATNQWLRLIDKIMVLRDTQKVNVILLAHSEVKTFNDPENQVTYDRFQLKLHKSAAALIRARVDAVLFANLQVYSKKEGDKTRAFGDGARIMYTERRPGFDAKNRLGLPFTLDLSWEAYKNASEEGKPESVEAVMARIVPLMGELKNKNPTLYPKVKENVEGAAGDVSKLLAYENRMKVLLQ